MCIYMFPVKTKLKLELVLKFDFHNFAKCWELVEIEKIFLSLWGFIKMCYIQLLVHM